jgi:hypothetical protein
MSARADVLVGELRKTSLPPAVDDQAVQGASDDFRRLLGEAQEAIANVTTAERKLAAAKEGDVDALAKAKRAGGADPGRRGVDKAERELEAARRDAEAAARAAEVARDDLAAAVAERRQALVDAAGEQMAVARAAARDALSAFELAHGRLVGAAVFEAWAARFPDRAKPRLSSKLPGLVGPNGVEYELAGALAALHESLADPDGESANA